MISNAMDIFIFHFHSTLEGRCHDVLIIALKGVLCTYVRRKGLQWALLLRKDRAKQQKFLMEIFFLSQMTSRSLLSLTAQSFAISYKN